jgi:hypothetical protein
MKKLIVVCLVCLSVSCARGADTNKVATGKVAGVSTNIPTAIQFLEWAQKGVICTALGHFWNMHLEMDGATVKGPPTVRNCILCGRVEYMRTEWVTQ